MADDDKPQSDEPLPDEVQATPRPRRMRGWSPGLRGGFQPSEGGGGAPPSGGSGASKKPGE